jgi:hypothetical protein
MDREKIAERFFFVNGTKRLDGVHKKVLLLDLPRKHACDKLCCGRSFSGPCKEVEMKNISDLDNYATPRYI